MNSAEQTLQKIGAGTQALNSISELLTVAMVRAHDLQSLTIEQIAEHAGLSLSAVAERIEDGRKRYAI